VHVFGMNWSPKQDPSHNVRRPSRFVTHQSSITWAARAFMPLRCLLADAVFIAPHRHTWEIVPQVDAERTYVQKLERLGKLTVHPTPCAGHRSCDEVGRYIKTAAMTSCCFVAHMLRTERPWCSVKAWTAVRDKK